MHNLEWPLNSDSELLRNALPVCGACSPVWQGDRGSLGRPRVDSWPRRLTVSIASLRIRESLALVNSSSSHHLVVSRLHFRVSCFPQEVRLPLQREEACGLKVRQGERHGNSGQKDGGALGGAPGSERLPRGRRLPRRPNRPPRHWRGGGPGSMLLTVCHLGKRGKDRWRKP